LAGVGATAVFHDPRFRGNVRRVGHERPARALIQLLARRGQRLDEKLADLGLESSAEPVHTVIIPIHVQRPAPMSRGGLARFGVAVHPPPAAHDELDVLRRAGPPDAQQALFRLGSRHTSQRTDLGVRELAAREGVSQAGQGGQSTRDTHLLARGTDVEADSPAQPVGARAEAVAPAAASVELADEIQQARGGSVEVR